MRFLPLTLLLLMMVACDYNTQQPSTTVSVSEALQTTVDSGFKRADKIREFSFPEDHGPHPDYATEWWYFTGNLQSKSGQHMGYQLTLFRLGLNSKPVADPSPWRSHQIYMGHFAVSDIQQGKHYSEERFSRAANGLAGAQPEPLRVWLGPWSIHSQQQSLFPLRLSAQNDQIAIDLELQHPKKPLVLQGERGLSQKSAEVGNASYYYSYTRIPTSGSVRIGERTLSVAGNSWFDREWSSSALAADQQGWDWFSLQLDDKREIMFYQLRDKQGKAQKFSAGVLVDQQGETFKLTLQNTQLKPLSNWQNDQGVSYPISWSLKIPQYQIDLQVDAAFNDQEMRHSVHYWEGAVVVSGSHQGRGYLELSGYQK
jgi:predicted secreted hydrolase